jgi:hypothetical protein
MRWRISMLRYYKDTLLRVESLCNLGNHGTSVYDVFANSEIRTSKAQRAA